ncbi:phosphoenolpyruvate-protein phosphotransferase [Parafrankia sp. EAN1pec]|uniref:phosphoenolpyruvate--protein phosphotransferase n=1 Tax=Parafrankia sp. (strain EAN1pec) TaxID=298653 RepID=UPI000054504B|nr:phosphoenolpyruvate-protein phosphotransferase [Frankia sp. EAN1pec]
MACRTATVNSRGGLHARPAALFVRAAAQQAVPVRIRKGDGPAVNAASMLSVLALGAMYGTVVTLEADGERAEEALDALAAILAHDQDAADSGQGDGRVGSASASDKALDETGGTGRSRATADVFVGLGVSPGLVTGPAFRMARQPRLPDPRLVLDPDEEAAAAARVLRNVASDLRAHAAATRLSAASDIVTAQAMMAEDPVLLDEVGMRVRSGLDAVHAIDAALADQRRQLEGAGGYHAERAADIDDIRHRAVAALLGLPAPGLPAPGFPFVLVAEDLAPADTATLDTDLVLALVTERGGPTSHTAILARALGLPAVVSCPGAMALDDGTPVRVDGTTGEVHVGVGVDVEADGAGHGEAIAQDTADVRQPGLWRTTSRAAKAGPARGGPGRTADGRPVQLLLNIGSAKDLRGDVAATAEGVGLFRTEFLFLNRRVAPTPDEQRDAYQAVFRAAGSRKVVVRTLDAGADKPLPFLSLPDEPNPALGVRGYRTVWLRPEVLDTQLGAIADAAAACDADVWVMAPMVSTPPEAEAFAAAARGHGLATTGVMVEVPAAALRAGRMLDTVDFLSVGTNDLGQYTLAADRQSGHLADLLSPWQPALLRLVADCAAAGEASGKPVGVCGEAAADPLLAAVLVGLGVTSLSMSGRSIAAVRDSLAAHTIKECRALAEIVIDADDAERARELATKNARQT